MPAIERSIDNIGFQIKDQNDPSKLAARVYALRDRTNSKVRFILYELDVNWFPHRETVTGDIKTETRETFPVRKIGESRSVLAAEEALKRYLSEKYLISK